MSRIILLFDTDGHAPPEDPPKDWRPPPFPDAAVVRRWIDDALDVTWVDEAHGVVENDQASLELRVPSRGPLDAIDVRAVGDALPLLAHLCFVNGWAAYDAAASSFIDFERELAKRAPS